MEESSSNLAVLHDQQYLGRVPCANVKEVDGSTMNCDRKASYVCSKCLLYCGRDCQVAHWSQHKIDCNSDLRKKDWQPTWLKQGREPDFISKIPYVHFGTPKYLWGNVPSYDVLNLAKNEGVDYNQDLALCFIASGDPRNLVDSIIPLPESYGSTCTCILNDRDEVVVCRNIIMLLLGMLQPPSVAAEVILHVWFSARLTSPILQKFKEIGPLIADVVGKIRDRRADVLLSKTWSFGTRQVSVRMYKKQWNTLLAMLDADHDVAETERNRLHIMLNATRLDYQERHLLFLPPAQRVCSHKMRKTGVLVPFGSSLEQFNCPNPTLFDTETSEWLQMDSSDPIESWSIEPILAGKVKHGIPKEDLYGHLHFHVRDKLEAFGRRIADLQIRFNLYCMDAAALPNVLPTCPRFDRVEVANMTDLPYLGLNTTLTVCGPLLKSPDENPHATLITMFMNAAELAERDLGQVYTRRQMKPGMEKARKFMPITPDMLVPNTSGAPAAIRMACAHNLFRDYDGLFAHYMDIFHFKDAGEAACLRIKDAHTIIDQWPMRLKKKFGEPGAQREFDLLMQSNSLGNERYVEWARER